MNAAARVIRDCSALLQQAAALVQQLDEGVFAGMHAASPRGTVAGHLRHVIEFFECFLNGSVNGKIDYNRRSRDLRTERDRRYALKRLAEIDHQLRASTPFDGTRRMLVVLEGDSGPVPAVSVSSVLRELDFLQSHTVHHFALIAMLLRLQGIEPGADFGVAPSTLEYWAREAACAA